LVVVALVVTGCGGSGGEVAEPGATAEPTAAPTATSVPATVTPKPVPTETPVQPTATSVPPTPTEVPVVDDEAAIREVHTRWMTEFNAIDERVDGRRSNFDVLDELAVDPQNQRSRDFADSLEEQQLLRVSPGYDSNISEVEILGDRASVFDCSQGRGEGWSEAGVLQVPADDFWKWRNTKLVKIDGVWFIEDFITGGENRCDPDTFADL